MRARLAAAVLLAITLATVAHAQIVRDGTIGPGIGVQPSGPNYLIPESMGQGVGPNLFHSFDVFNLSSTESALFTAFNPYDNLIARVTGGSASFLDGTFTSAIPGADVYFLNPAGVMTGPNFTLNVPASFYLSSANHLELGDGLGRFDASNPGATVLSAAPPSAFGFTGPTAAPISLLQTTLAVAPGEAITVIGGAIDQSGGQLLADSGRVDLIAVASGDVGFDPSDRATAPDVSGVDAFDRVDVRSGAVIGVSGDPAGSIFVRGSTVSLDQASLFANTLGTAPGPAIGIDVAASLDLLIASGSLLQSASAASANAGATHLFAGRDVFFTDTVLDTFSLSSGNSGDVVVSAGQDLFVQAFSPSFLTFIDSSAGGTGTAGSISLLAERDLVVASAGIDSSGSGLFSFGGGAIELWSGRDLIVFNTPINASSSGDGAAGLVKIDGDRDVTLQFVSLDTASRDGFAGPAGTISVDAGNDLLIDTAFFDATSDSFFGAAAGAVTMGALGTARITNAVIDTASNGVFAGPAGAISVDAGVDLFVDSVLFNSTSDSFFGAAAGAVTIGAFGTTRIADSVIDTTGFFAPGGTVAISGFDVTLDNTLVGSPGQLLGTGEGGSVSVVGTQSITFQNGTSVITGTQGAGSAGSVSLTAPEVTLIGDGAGSSGIISTSTSDSGDAGAVMIGSQRFNMTNGYGILTSTTGFDGALPAGRAGDVVVTAAESATISGEAGIFSSTLGDGDAGDITITSPNVDLDGGLVGAFAGDDMLAGTLGNAGDITFDVGDLTLRNGALVSAGTAAETTFGMGGALTIDATRSVSVDSDSAVLNGVQGQGDGGPLTINASSLSVSGIVESQTLGDGNAGSTTIRVGNLLVDNGGSISTTSDGAGDAAPLTIAASGAVTVRGANADGASVIASGALSTGAAGTIAISAPAVNMAGGRITTASFDSADAGSISIDTDTLTMNGDALITSAAGGTGPGGSVTIDTRVTEIFDSTISTSSIGTGDAGRISVDASERLQMVRGQITSRAENAFGGTIAINGEGLAQLPDGTLVPITGSSPTSGVVRLVDSQITTSVGNGVGDGGNVLVDGGILVLDDSRITATAVGGDGGNILLASDFVLANTADGRLGLGGLLDASSSLGVDGTVSVRSPEVDLASEMAPLPSAYLDAASLMRPECGARRAEGGLTFASRASPPAAEEGFPFDLPIDPEVDRLRKRSQAVRADLRAGKRDEASRALEQAEQAAAALPPSADLVYLWIHLGSSYERLARATPADAGNALLRAHAALTRALALARELGDARARSYALGNLGGLYARQQRFDEALRLSRRAIVAASEADAHEATYRWRWQAARSLWAQGQAHDALIEYRSAVAELHGLRQAFAGRSPDAATWFERDAAPLYLEFVDALLTGADRTADPTLELALLLDARATVEMLKAAELRDYFQDDCVAAFEAKVIDIDRVSKTAAVVYPILLENRLELLVTLPSGVRRYSVPVPAERVETQARRFRQVLQIPAGTTHLAIGQELYAWLVAPYAEALAAESVDTLVFVPGGALRAIPMAALHDGERFVIERYAVAVAPALSLVEPRPMDPATANVLLAGISEPVPGFAALPSVDAELASIEQLYGGTKLLNEDFRLDRVESEMIEGRPSIFHVASHGLFTGEPETSFVLAYDGKLTMDRMRDYLGVAKFRDDPLELLVLSACETAAGDERAALGLSGVAIRAGARSAMGSLWQINDVATRELVAEFYEQLKDPSLSKAQVLQRAQQKLLASSSFSHPVYWSPFLMINNWL